MNKQKIIHVRDEKRGAITFMTSIEEFNELHIGVAFCSPKDSFNKAKGRLIAAGRLEKNAQITKFTGDSYSDVTRIWSEMPKPRRWKSVSNPFKI